MSRDAFCYFYIKNENGYKLAKKVIINKLKEIEDDLEDYGHYANVDTNDYEYSYWGKIFPETVVEEKDIKERKNDDIYFNEGAEKKYIDITKGASLDDLKTIKGIDCYSISKYMHRGNFYNTSDFSSLIEKFSSKLENERKRSYKLSWIKNSIDFYKLNEDEKQSLIDDLNYSNELVEEYERKVYICQYMIDTMCLFKDMFGDWKDDVEVYIFVE